MSEDLRQATQAVTVFEAHVQAAVTDGAANEKGCSVLAEMVTLVVKAAVALRKAVPNAADFGGSTGEAAGVAAALEAAGRLLAAAIYLQSSTGAFNWLILFI